MLAVLEVMLVDREMIKKLIASIYISAVIPVGYTIFNVVTAPFAVHQWWREPLRGHVRATEPLRDLPDAAHRHGRGAGSRT